MAKKQPAEVVVETVNEARPAAPDYILVDSEGNGTYLRADIPARWDRDRVIVVGKRTAEHVGEDESGAWQYRVM